MMVTLILLDKTAVRLRVSRRIFSSTC